MALNASIIGKGKETMVLCYGFGGNKSVWEAVVPKLSQKRKLVLFDWRFASICTEGCSFENFADELILLLDNMKLKGVIFVGHSMSGMVGCIASIKRPDLFTHLVLVSASPRYIKSEEYEGGSDLSTIERIISNMQSNFDSWCESFATTTMPTEDPIPLQKFEASIKEMTQYAALELAKMIFYSDNRHILKKVELPCTIIQNSHDFVVPPSVAHYIKNNIQGKASVEIIEGKGHFPQLTSPAKFLDAINKALI